MILIIPFLVIIGIAAGPMFASIKSTCLRRTLGWLLVIMLLLNAHLALVGYGAFTRMIGICCVLLGSMKGLVYAEWARRQTLTMPRYLIFSLLWFGMDPATFLTRNRNLNWKDDLATGALLTTIGLLGTWIVARLGLTGIFITFVPLSIGFHFGVLRIMKAAHRYFGFPVRTLFHNPLLNQGMGDFWSRRWNVGYSQMMQRIIGRPIASLAGKPVGIMAVFIGSGLFHEAAITLSVMSGFGLPTLYFTFQGLLTLAEKKWNRSFGMLPTLLCVILPMGFLFPAKFQSEVIETCMEAFRSAH